MSARHAVRPALLRLRLQIRLHDASARLEVSQVRGQSARREAARQCRAPVLYGWMLGRPQGRNLGVGAGAGWGGGWEGVADRNPMTRPQNEEVKGWGVGVGVVTQ